MPDPRFWRLSFWLTVWKLAWKELRASRGKSAVLVVALALSISGISGVRGAANVAIEALRQDSRAFLAGDLCADTTEEISERQFAALDAMRAQGIEWTLVTMTLTMASSDHSPDATFASVKAIDPEVYPLYGGVKMSAALRGNGVMVSGYTLHRLRVGIGDSIRIAGRTFRITAVGKAEPEQIMGILTRGVRCVLSDENYEKCGLARAGNRTG